MHKTPDIWDLHPWEGAVNDQPANQYRLEHEIVTRDVETVWPC